MLSKSITITSKEHSLIFSQGTLKENTSLNTGFRVHLKIGVLRFSTLLSPNCSHTFTYGSEIFKVFNLNRQFFVHRLDARNRRTSLSRECVLLERDIRVIYVCPAQSAFRILKKKEKRRRYRKTKWDTERRTCIVPAERCHYVWTRAMTIDRWARSIQRVVTWFPIDVLSFEIPRFQKSQRQYGIARMIAQRAQEFSAFVFSWRLQGLPERRLLR